MINTRPPYVLCTYIQYADPRAEATSHRENCTHTHTLAYADAPTYVLGHISGVCFVSFFAN